MDNLVGAHGRQVLLVDEDTAIRFLNHRGARVLGTPWMILWMERTSRDAVKPLLPEGWDTVGTLVNVRHLAAAPMGVEVVFEARVMEQNGKRLLFQVSATWGAITIGEGTHERAMIDVERFAARLVQTR
jgi:predicted thioesterase